MASLEDVRRFIARHPNDSLPELYRKVAREFGMSQEDAERIVRDEHIAARGALDDAGAIAPAAAVLGIAAAQTTTGAPGQSGPGVAAAALAVSEAEGHDRERVPGEATRSDDDRVERSAWPLGENRSDWDGNREDRD
jgi:hypothetical protein